MEIVVRDRRRMLEVGQEGRKEEEGQGGGKRGRGRGIEKEERE